MVTVSVLGERLAGNARAETYGDAVAAGLEKFLTEFSATAGRYGVGLDAGGRPDPREVEAAVREGRVVMVVVESGVPKVS